MAARTTIKRKKGIRINKTAIYSTISILSMAALLYTVFFIQPSTWVDIYYAPFFLLLTLWIGFGLKVIIKPSSPPILVAIAINTILVLRLLGFKELYYPILIVALTITLIYFFTLTDEDDKLQTTSSNKETSTTKE